MDNTWRDERRKGEPHNNSGGGRQQQPPAGFEGMNYEQKRRPYNENDNKEMSNDTGGNKNRNRRN